MVPESTVCLFSLFCSHMNGSLLLLSSEDDGEGSPLGWSALPRGQPKGGDEPSEEELVLVLVLLLLTSASSATCVLCLKLLVSPSPSSSICSEINNPSAVLMVVVMLLMLDPPSILRLRCSYRSSTVVAVGMRPCKPALMRPMKSGPPRNKQTRPQ